MKTFAFDIYLKAVARVTAKDKEEALDRLDELDCISDVAGTMSCSITEMSLMAREETNHQPALFEIIHEDGRMEEIED